MQETAFANFELSADGQTVSFHGLKGRWNLDGSWESNFEARKSLPGCLACDKMSIIKPVGVANWLRESLDTNRRLRNESRLRVTAYIAMMLFLEGNITPGNLEQVREDAGEVVIPGVRVGNHDLTLYVMRGDDPRFEAVNTVHRAMLAW